MPYRPHIIDLLETGLAECSKYHDGLDSFLIRAGVSRLASMLPMRRRSNATGRPGANISAPRNA